MKVLELFSGIGGMHLALKESGLQGEIVGAMDINPVCNKIYKENFPETKLFSSNLCGLSVKKVEDLQANCIFMSPPCQPFTRNGAQNDEKDPRCAPFKHLLTLLPKLSKIETILCENVKGFELSVMHKHFIKTLQENQFSYKEFLLSPKEFGVPNSRTRYYLLARRNHLQIADLEISCDKALQLKGFLQENVSFKHRLSDEVLKKRAKILDVVFETSTNSCCFTKSYGRYVEGTGSVFSDKTKAELDEVYKKYNEKEDSSCLSSLNLRFFTPREVANLMCFPENYKFPEELTDQQLYNVLGNSINVKVVSELIKLIQF